MKRIARLIVLLAVLASCGVGKQLTASSGDLEDYRAFRIAARAGTRLSRAQSYLERHPRGAFVDEVRAAFDAEEPAYFERAKASRALALAYAADLPRGPHAEAAIALLVLFDVREEEAELDKLLVAASRSEATLAWAALRRTRVVGRIFSALGALTDPSVYGARIDAAPDSLRRALEGPVAESWGAGKTSRVDDVFFTLPTRTGQDARVATIEIAFETESGRVVSGSLAGEDLFVRWAEVDTLRLVDPTDVVARAEVARRSTEKLDAVLEALLPRARCGGNAEPPALLVRRCEGWSATVTMGARAGDRDAVVIRSPHAQKGLEAR